MGGGGDHHDGSLTKGHNPDAVVDDALGQAEALHGLGPELFQFCHCHGLEGLVGQELHILVIVVIPGTSFEDDDGARSWIMGLRTQGDGIKGAVHNGDIGDHHV